MIARKSLLIVVTQFFVRFLGWIGLLVLVKLWGGFAPEALGMIGFAMAFISVFSVIGDLGFNSAHIKRISEGKDLGLCIGTYAAIKLVLISIMVSSIFIALIIWVNILHQSFYDATTETIVVIFVLYYIFTNLQQISTATFNGRNEIAKMQITSMFENFIKVPLTIVLALAGVSLIGHPSPVHWPQIFKPLQQFLAAHPVGSLAMTYVLGIVTSCFVGFWLLRKYPIKKPTWALSKSYLTFALPILLISIIGTISTNIDKIMIGYFWTSTEVGYYFSVQQILQIILILSSAITIVLFPAYSEFHTSKNYDKIKETTYTSERYISMVMMPIVVVIILFSTPVIYIMLNSSFLPAVPVLITLTLYALITSFIAPYSSLVIGINRPDLTAKIGFLTCFVNIGLNFLFIPKWGLLSPIGINGPTGAAIATLISSIVYFGSLRYVAKKTTGIHILQSHTPRHILAGIIMGGIIYILSLFVSYIRWFHLVAFSLIGVGIYLLILYALKEFTKKDFMFFLDLIHPKETLKYISSELKNEK